MRKKILYINHNGGNGGSEQSLLDILSNLDREKFEPFLAVPDKGLLYERSRNLGVHCIILPQQSWRWFYPGWKNQVKTILLLPYILYLIFRWYLFIRKEKFDLVHVNINRVIEPLIAVKWAGIPLIIHFRDIPSRMERQFVWGWKWFYRFMRTGDYWVANSSATFNDIHPQSMGTSIVTEKIFNFKNLKIFDQRLRQNENRYYQSAGKIHIGMIAALVRWKNQRDFIQLAKNLDGELKNTQFLIIGSGPLDGELKNQVKELGLSDNVQFTGQIQNIPAFLRQVDILVHTTYNEPFGRVFIEAMAAKIPVVAYQTGGASDIILDGETGFLVKDYDIDLLASKVRKLANDPQLRQSLGQKGRKRVEEVFSESPAMSKIHRLYHNINN